jgi:hypothetical protein
MLLREEMTLHPKWGAKRPEEMRPEEFIDLTSELYGEIPPEERFPIYKPLITREDYSTKRVWRHPSKNFHSDELQQSQRKNEAEATESGEFKKD